MAQKINVDPDSVSALTLAYLGDSVYELTLRSLGLERHNGNANDVNRFVKGLSNAVAQAKMADALADELTEKEMRIFKHGRNAKSVSAPKTCSISEYRKATGLEALCGYLYIEDNCERIRELVETGIERING